MPEGAPGAPWWVVVSWMITIVGWVVVDCRSNRNASASETFKRVQDVENLLDQFRSNVIETLLLAGKDAQADRLRRAAIDDTKKIQLVFRHLRQRNPRFDVETEYLKLKRLATGEDFESLDRDALPIDDQRIRDIDEATDNLILNINRMYDGIYRRS